jgi:hypothetical protein
MSQPVVRFDELCYFIQHFVRSTPDGSAKNNQLHNIDPALSTLDPGDQRLMTAELLCQITLCQASRLSF